MLGLQQRKIGMDAQVEEPLEGTILPEEWEGAPHVEEIIHLHITEQDIQQHLDMTMIPARHPPVVHLSMVVPKAVVACSRRGARPSILVEEAVRLNIRAEEAAHRSIPAPGEAAVHLNILGIEGEPLNILEGVPLRQAEPQEPHVGIKEMLPRYMMNNL